MLTDLEVKAPLIAAGITCPIICADQFYETPALGWHQVLAPHFGKLLTALDYNYAEDARDCDDFADFGAWYARYVHSKNRGEKKRTALAVGAFWFLREDLTGHAIIVALEGPNASDVRFYEPQFGIGGFSSCLQPLNPQPNLKKVIPVFCRL